MTNNLEDDISVVVAHMDEQQSNQESETNTPQEDIQDIYVLIVREHEEVDETAQVVDSIPLVPAQSAPDTTHKDSYLSTYAFVSCFLFLTLSILMFQCFCMINPPIATITIIPKSKQVQLSGTMQLGRVLPPLTISQSQTTKSTGKGHQNARTATGTVTFFNGLFTQQFVASGTVYTGQNGVAIVTSEDATIPPGSPNTGYGTVKVTAQAVTAGTSGNIPAGDINIAINNGLLVRNNQFHNGQDERDFPTVSQQDINKISTPLTSSVIQNMHAALLGQLTPSEQLQLLPCTSTVTSDHQPGIEATTVKVTVSENCSGVAVNTDALNAKVTDLLKQQATKNLGLGYSLLGRAQIYVTSATVSKQVTLSFKSLGTWVYALGSTEQQNIKKIIAGKTKEKALQLLSSLPGIKRVSMQLSGFGDDTRLPKDIGRIHFQLLIGL
jgi:hypothetical protein